MVRFIRQEAEEKANEISVSAEEVRSSDLSDFNNFFVSRFNFADYNLSDLFGNL